MRALLGFFLLIASATAVADQDPKKFECNVAYVTVSGLNFAGPSKGIDIDPSHPEPNYSIQLADSQIHYEGTIQFLFMPGANTDPTWLKAKIPNRGFELLSSSWNKRGIWAELRFVAPKAMWKNNEKTFASLVCRASSGV